MPHVALLATGGTIASRNHGSAREVDVRATELFQAANQVGGLDSLLVEAQEVSSIVSFAATIPDILALAATVRAKAESFDGVVITHGTDTLEETAFLLALTHTGSNPVVLTGAQRPFDDGAPDGPRNLHGALRWAASDVARDSGVTVAFADQILPAIGVRKVHSLAPQAFDAPERGPIGQVDELGVRRHGRAPHVPLLPAGLSELPRVDIVSQYLGADASAVEHAFGDGAQGIVISGFGSGNTTPATTAACLRLLERGVPILVTSRTGAGPVVGLYTGGGAALTQAGAVFAGDLSPWQARILLAAALAVESDPTRVVLRCQQWLREAGALPAGS